MVVTVSSWLNFGLCAPGKGVCGGAKFLAPPYYSQHAVFASSPSAFFIHSFFCYWEYSGLIAAHVVDVSDVSTLMSLCTQFKTLFVMFFIAAVLPLILLKIFRVHFYGLLMSRWSFVD